MLYINLCVCVYVCVWRVSVYACVCLSAYTSVCAMQITNTQVREIL